MAKIITVYGDSGSGKTTFAVNLACAIASRAEVVIIISGALNCGGIQNFFGQKIENGQGFFTALNDTSEQPQNKLTEVKQNGNIHLLGIPNENDECYISELEDEKAKSLIRRLSTYSDYIIIDAEADLYNPMTAIALDMANIIYCVLRPSIKTCMWHASIHNLFTKFGVEESVKTILNLHDIGCSADDFLKSTNARCEARLPDVPNAVILENMGHPIYFQNDKACRKYKAAIESILDDIEKGGV